ncbi:MAG: hypothetical protein AAF823_10460 [Planctomycetota bacterium]
MPHLDPKGKVCVGLIFSQQAMTTFDDQPLFTPGHSAVRVGPLVSRHDEQPGFTGVGAHLVQQGIDARDITHTGRIVDDSPAALQQRIAAIEAYVGQPPCTLVTHDGRTLPACAMIEARFDPPVALGPRTAADFTIRYLQLDPAPTLTPAPAPASTPSS